MSLSNREKSGKDLRQDLRNAFDNSANPSTVLFVKASPEVVLMEGWLNIRISPLSVKKKKKKNGGGSVIVWCCILASGVEELNGVTNAEKYHQIRIHHVLPTRKASLFSVTVIQNTVPMRYKTCLDGIIYTVSCGLLSPQPWT